MRRRRTLAAALVATVLAAVGASVGTAAQPAAAATASATVVVAPDDGGIVGIGKGIGVSVTVTNTGTTALPAGRVALSAEKSPVASTTTLLDSLAHPPQILLGFTLDGATTGVPSLAAGAAATVHVDVPDDVLSGIFDGSSGARLLYARYRATGVQKVAESAITRIANGSKVSVGLGTIIPVLAPAGSSGIVDVQQQQQLAAPDGAWGRALEAAEADPSATVALDPAVLASIRIVGGAAPSEAGGFLDALGRLPNEFLRLPYADTDLTLARAAGVRTDLDPTSFAGVTPASTAQGPTPAPTASAGSTSATATDLTAWNWSEREVAWPVPGSTSSSVLAGLAQDGDEVLLSSNDVLGSTAGRSSGPLARIGSAGVLVSDATVSSLLEAASAEGPAADAALATLTGLLATGAVSGETSGVLATIGRSGAPQRLDRVLRLLDRQSWIRPSRLSDLGSVEGAAQVRLKAGTVRGSLLGTAHSLLDGEAEVQQLGTAIAGGTDTVTPPQRLTLLGTMSAAWRGDDTGWRTAATGAERTFKKLVGQVRLAKQSSPNLVGGDGTLSVYVDNALPAPIRVVVHAGASNGAVQFTNASGTVVVPAGGRAKADLGFRSIRNGRTDLTLSLTTPNGTPIGSEVNRGATVRAGFDTIVAVVLLTALGLLLALGVYRNVKRRRQPRAAAE
jgi:hypothetical protein